MSNTEYESSVIPEEHGKHEEHEGSMYMSYGGGYGDTSGGDGTGFFGGSGSIFGGGMKCCIQNMLIAGIVIFMLYTFVYVPMKQQEKQSCHTSQRSSFQATPATVAQPPVSGPKSDSHYDKLCYEVEKLIERGKSEFDKLTK